MADPALIQRARAWMQADPDPRTAAELALEIERNERGERGDLADRMAGPLEFGTAGLRGVLGAGESRMNLAVVRRTTAGLARYLLETTPGAGEMGVVVGYDGRTMSREFALEAALVLAACGVRAHLFTSLCATPLTAYGVLALGAAAGVMVTASHNPPEYNGYKVYWRDGAQITPPHDVGIASAIAQIGPARDVALLDERDARQRGLLVDIPTSLEPAYLDAVAALSSDRRGRDLIRIAYTPLHGTGDRYTRAALARAGFEHVWSVPAQREPDGCFPTVSFPNPEEKGALDLSYALAAEVGANLVLANDPDADRLAVAVPAGSSPGGGFRQLSGNELGVLLGEYVLRTTAALGEARLVVTTIVSSPMLGHIARTLGVRYAETLTGFKWIASTAMRMEQEQGARFVFGYEEALGYTVGTVVRDKDGISAAAVFAELAAAAAAEGRTVLDELERVARAYGLYASGQRSVWRKGVEGAQEIAAMMERLRDALPTRIGDHAVVAVRDVERGVETRGGEASRLALPRSNVLIFDLEGGARVVARPSGTEPKIKYYFDLREEVAPGEPFAAAKERADARLGRLIDAFVAVAGA
jgi:phosphomannomutase